MCIIPYVFLVVGRHSVNNWSTNVSNKFSFYGQANGRHLTYLQLNTTFMVRVMTELLNTSFRNINKNEQMQTHMYGGPRFRGSERRQWLEVKTAPTSPCGKCWRWPRRPRKKHNPIDVISINLQSGGDSPATTFSKLLLAHVAERERRQILYDSPKRTTVRIVSAMGPERRGGGQNHKCPVLRPRVAPQGRVDAAALYWHEIRK